MDRAHHAEHPGPARSRSTTCCSRSRWRLAPAECVDLVRAAELTRAHPPDRSRPALRTSSDCFRPGHRRPAGEIVSVEWRENLAYWHFAHSFVRGRWANRSPRADDPHQVLSRPGPAGVDVRPTRADRVVRVADPLTWRSASGPRSPTAVRTAVRLKSDCPYFAPAHRRSNGNPGHWARDPCWLDHSPQALRRGLESGPYGRCAYRCDNNVVDHQVSNTEPDQ